MKLEQFLKSLSIGEKITLHHLEKKFKRRTEEIEQELKQLLLADPYLGFYYSPTQIFIRGSNDERKEFLLTKLDNSLLEIKENLSLWEKSYSMVTTDELKELAQNIIDQIMEDFINTVDYLFDLGINFTAQTHLSTNINQSQFESIESIFHILLRKQQEILLTYDYLNLWDKLGLIADNMGLLPTAEKFYKIYLSHNENAFRVWNNLGIVYYKMKNLTEAERCYLKAIKINKKYIYPWTNLGLIYEFLQRYEDAEFCYLHALELNKEDPDLWFNLGLAYYHLDKVIESEKCYKMSLEYKKDNVYAIHNLAVLLYDQGLYEESESFYKKALELKPDYAIAWSNLALLHKKQEKFEESEKCYRKSLEYNSNDKETWRGLGYLLEEMFRLDEAEECFKKAEK